MRARRLLGLANVPAKLYPCDLAVYASEREVPRRFERLCVISETPGHGVLFDTGSEQTEHRESALRAVRQRACRCGADALIMVVPESPRSTIDAVAIRYTSE